MHVGRDTGDLFCLLDGKLDGLLDVHCAKNGQEDRTGGLRRRQLFESLGDFFGQLRQRLQPKNNGRARRHARTYGGTHTETNEHGRNDVTNPHQLLQLRRRQLQVVNVKTDRITPHTMARNCNGVDAQARAAQL